jgi:dipeptidyl aminopeptidase/acylaminoacyl peptidase
MALARVAEGLAYVDPTNLLLYGLSRGGMMSFLALKQPALEALTFASKLAQLGRRYQLIVYADDNHEAANNRRNRDASILAWFELHARPPE